MPVEERISAFRLAGGLEGVWLNVCIGPGSYRVGALEENDIRVPHPAVSRRHAILEVADGRIRVRDLGSKNGTWINGERVEEGELVPGDVLGLGPVEVTVAVASPEDVDLAIRVENPRDRRGGLLKEEDTETGTEGPGGGDGRTAVLADIAAELVASGRPGLSAALSVMARRYSARGALLLELTRGERLVRAAVGLSEFSEIMDKLAAEVRARAAQIRTTIVGRAATRRSTVAWACYRWQERSLLVAALVDPANEPGNVDRVLATAVEVLARVLARTERDLGGDSRLPGLVFPEGHVVGSSMAMQGVYQQLRQLVNGEIPVLLVGETGVGKEHLARVLHLSSPRRSGPFVAVNCAAIPAELLEAELFGIEKGVATGVAARVGKFQQASGGVLFLDEIGEMPLELQPKLLRALQSMEVHPVGAKRPVPVDVRLVTATNCDINRRVRERRFRPDLYYRIAGYTLEVPPLRERRKDIPELVERFLATYVAEVRKPIRGLTAGALSALVEAPWPGNVRQLEQEVRRLVYLCPAGQAIDSSMLSPEVLCPTEEMDLDSLRVESDLSIERHTAELERRLITLALARTKGNRTRAAQLLGISRNGLALKMARLGLSDGRA